MNTNASTTRFKTLRSFDPATLESKPLELPRRVHFENAKGGLRVVEQGETRKLAAQSAKRLLAARLNDEEL